MNSTGTLSPDIPLTLLSKGLPEDHPIKCACRAGTITGVRIAAATHSSHCKHYRRDPLAYHRPASPNEATFINAFDNLTLEVHENAINKGFYSTGREFNDAEKILLNVTELVEGFEAIRDGNEGMECAKVPGITNLEEEIADAVIRAMDYAKAKGLNLGRAIVLKHRFNISRSFRHGGKKC